MAGRLNDQQTQRRVLSTAVELVQERGIATGVEHITFEEVIKTAGVSRTSAYRRWPRRELFHGEVLLTLAKSATVLPQAKDEIISQAVEIIETRAWQLEEPQGRRDIVVELLRRSVDTNLVFISHSKQWQTHFDLLLGHIGIADQELRDQVRAELIATQQNSTTQQSRIYAQLAGVLGYRLTGTHSGPSGFDLMGEAIKTVLFGALSTGRLGSNLSAQPRKLRAFGSRELAPWQPVTYAMVAMVFSFIEPDPGAEWNSSRIADLLPMIKSFPGEN